MIGYLRGTILQVEQDAMLLDVSGVGYRIFASTTTLAAMQHVDPATLVALYIETHVREDHIHLYGFTSRDEQIIFTLLTTVQGVGNKMALAILSLFGATDIVTMILASDTASFTRVSGVGKRIAERITSELKNKCPALDGATLTNIADGQNTSATPAPLSATSSPISAQDNGLSDAVQVLEQLGYSRSDAYRAATAAIDGGATAIDAIVTDALQRL